MADPPAAPLSPAQLAAYLDALATIAMYVANLYTLATGQTAPPLAYAVDFLRQAEEIAERQS